MHFELPLSGSRLTEVGSSWRPLETDRVAIEYRCGSVAKGTLDALEECQASEVIRDWNVVESNYAQFFR